MTSFNRKTSKSDKASDPPILCKICLVDYAPKETYNLQQCHCVFCIEVNIIVPEIVPEIFPVIFPQTFTQIVPQIDPEIVPEIFVIFSSKLSLKFPLSYPQH